MNINEIKKNITKKIDALPSRLSNELLFYISTVLDEALNKKKNRGELDLVIPTYLIKTLLNKVGSKHFELDELLKYFEFYFLEISLETLSRQKLIKYKKATLQTILTDRDVKIQHLRKL